MLKIFKYIFIIAFVAQLSAQHNAIAPWAENKSKPENLVISLMTFSPGDQLTDWFGHTALVVNDTLLKVARVYNFGLFSFDDGFISRFIKGRLIFWAGDASLGAILTRYVRANRTIVFQELDLPAKQKLLLAKKLVKAVLPENSHYLYHHYHDNCATRLRDLIDDAVNGQLDRATQKESELTYRDFTRRYTDQNQLMQWLLMFLMNDSIDEKINFWDEMFLPDELSKHVASLVYEDSSGAKVNLVKSSFTYYDSGREPVPLVTTVVPWWTILSGVLISLLAIVLGKWKSSGESLARILFAIYNLLFTTLFGFIGTILTFMSLFTDHLVTHGNENIFVANPLLLIAAIVSLILIFKKSEKLWFILKRIWYAIAFFSLLLLILKFFPLFDQDNFMILVILIPANLGFAAGHFLSAKK